MPAGELELVMTDEPGTPTIIGNVMTNEPGTCRLKHLKPTYPQRQILFISCPILAPFKNL